MSFIKKGYLDILIAGILWGTIGLFVNLLGSEGIEASTAAFLRIALGAMAIGIVIIIKDGMLGFYIDKRGLIICAALGIFSQGMFNFCYNESIEYTGVATASVLLYTAPVFVCIMASVIFKEKITAIKRLALVVNVMGCILTVTGGNFMEMEFSAKGVSFGVAAGFLYALMTIISKTTTDRYNPFTILFYSFVFGSIFLAITVRPINDINESFCAYMVILAACYGIIPTAQSYVFYMRGLSKKPETSKVPVVASVETVTAAIIGMGFLQETMSPVKIIGIFLVVCSIIIMNLIKAEKTITKI